MVAFLNGNVFKMQFFGLGGLQMFSDLGDNMFMFSFGLRDLADILRKVILLVYKKLHRRDVYADLSHCFQIPKPYRQYR